MSVYEFYSENQELRTFLSCKRTATRAAGIDQKRKLIEMFWAKLYCWLGWLGVMITILWSKLKYDRLTSSLANYHVFIYLLTVFHALAPFHKGNHLKAQSNKSDEQKPQTINIKYFKCSMAVTTHYTVDLEMLSSMAFIEI